MYCCFWNLTCRTICLLLLRIKCLRFQRMQSTFVFLLLDYDTVGMTSDVSEQHGPHRHTPPSSTTKWKKQQTSKNWIWIAEKKQTITGQFERKNLQTISQHVPLSFNLQVAALVAMLFSKELIKFLFNFYSNSGKLKYVHFYSISSSAMSVLTSPTSQHVL